MEIRTDRYITSKSKTSSILKLTKPELNENIKISTSLMKLSINILLENYLENCNISQQKLIKSTFESLSDNKEIINHLQNDIIWLKESMTKILSYFSESTKQEYKETEQLNKIQINLESSKNKLKKIKQKSKSISNKIRTIERKISLCGGLNSDIAETDRLPKKNYSSNSLNLKIKPWTGRKNTLSTKTGSSSISLLIKLNN